MHKAPVSFWMFMLCAAIMAALVSAQVLAADARFCGGKAVRNPATVRAFKKEWPCIAPCDKTWQIDHIIPLAVGGCDAIINMQWLPGTIKTCAGTTCKDRWERRIYLREGTVNGR